MENLNKRKRLNLEGCKIANWQAVGIVLTPEAEKELKQLVARHPTPQQIALRAKILLLANTQINNSQIARQLNVHIEVPRLWRKRWQSLEDVPLSELSVQERLTDAPRSGKPSCLTPQQVCQMLASSCEQPLEGSQRPVTGLLAKSPPKSNDGELSKSLAPATRHVFLKRTRIKAASNSLLANAPLRYKPSATIKFRWSATCTPKRKSWQNAESGCFSTMS
jgi:putative transposase